MTNKNVMPPTIAAISTPFGTGGLGVIRISGADAVAVADRVFRAADKKTLASAATHTIHYGHITDADGTVIDEVMAAVMLAPKTFTAEDVVEISTHGSTVAIRRVLERILASGAALAMPGEFTRRAFLNGRIDLSQAEAVIDIINANSDSALSAAVSQLEGTLSHEIEAIRKPLLYILAQFAALVDYPDEDIADLSEDSLGSAIDTAIMQCAALMQTAHSGRMVREGVRCAILGKPNTGKSSLLNKLARADRAIVTDIAGTTRDAIEEFVSLGGIPLRLTDTAGIRNTADAVEQIGVAKSTEYAQNSDIAFVMLDGSAPYDEKDMRVLELTEHTKRIILINKSDMPQMLDTAVLPVLPQDTLLRICAKSGDGLDTLQSAVADICDIANITPGSVALSNIRHIEAVRQAHNTLCEARQTLDAGMPMDMCAIDISAAVGKLGEITGIEVAADIIDTVFAEFCVGK